MGGIIAATQTGQASRRRERMAATAQSTAYRGEPGYAQTAACLLCVQARDDEAVLLQDSHSIMALHGYITAASLQRQGLDSPDALKSSLDRGAQAILQRLDGEFSVVHFNNLASSLTFYCSTSATRPLYFQHTTAQTVVATEIRQLLGVGENRRAMNRTAWAQHILFGHQLLDMEDTLYHGIRRAHSGRIYQLDVRTGALKRHAFPQSLAIDDTITREEAEAKLVDTVDNAVLDALRPQHMGLALSGGLDSGLILALADRHLARQDDTARLSTYSIGFPGWSMDESAVIEETLCAQHRRGAFVDGTRHPPSSYFEHLSQATDLAPLALTDCYIEMLGPVMAKDDCRFRLSGLAGDLTLGFGLSYLAEYLRTGRVYKAIRDAVGFENRQPFSLTTALRRVYRLCRPAKQSQRPPPPAWLPAAQRPAFDAGLDRQADYVAQYGRSIGPRMLLIDAFRAGAWSDIAEQHAARWGMDLLSPLTHQSLIDLGFALPHDWLDGGSHNRRMIRDATAQLVPDSARAYRPKVAHNAFVTGDKALLRFADNPSEWRLVDEHLVSPEHLATTIGKSRSTGQIDLGLSTLLRAEHLARRFD